MEPPTLLDLLAVDEITRVLLGYTDPIALAHLQGCSCETRIIQEFGAAWRLKLETVLWGAEWRWSGWTSDGSDGSDSDGSISDDSSCAIEEQNGDSGAEETTGGELLPEVLLRCPSGATKQQLRIACQLADRGDSCAVCLDWADLFRRHGVAAYLPHVRRRHLNQSLRQRGLKLRSDSWVCKQYVAGTGQFGVEEVCDKVEEMSFFHQSGVFNAKKCDVGINAWRLPAGYMPSNCGFGFGQILYALRCFELPRELEQMVDDSTTLGEDSPLRHSRERFIRWARRTLNHEQSEVAKHRVVCLVTTASDLHPYHSESPTCAWDEYCKRWEEEQGACGGSSSARTTATGGAGQLEQPRAALRPVTITQDQPERMIYGAPPSLHDKIRAWALTCPRLRYEQLTDEEKAARRMSLAERYHVANQQVERIAAAHIVAIRNYAANGVAGGSSLSFPPGMDAELRARLHEFAEEVDLEHFSVGANASRRLIVCRPL